MNVKKWLTEEEKGLYQAHLDYLADLDKHPERSQAFTDAVAVSNKFLESLAVERELSEARRALLEKHEYSVPMMAAVPYHRCAECWGSQKHGHTPDCAWDAALKGKGE